MPNEKKFRVAIVGATGAVGQKIKELLEDKQFPIEELVLLSSKRSAGKKVPFGTTEITTQEARPESFKGIDIAFFSAGGSVSTQLAQAAIDYGSVVIDNTSAFRMDAEVPLIVPEVNAHDVEEHQGIIANPNCSTIQMVVALKPILNAFGLTRVNVSTYQAVSGAGLQAVEELEAQTAAYLEGKEMIAEVLPVGGEMHHYPIAYNALPQIDVFEDNGYTAEEMKMINETKKILHTPDLAVAATCIRLPIVTSHSESVYIEIEKDGVSVEDMKHILNDAPGIIVKDNPANQDYPTPLDAVDQEGVFVGRIRKDLSNERGFHLWIVSDNLMKGAALNTVQIAQSLIEQEIV